MITRQICLSGSTPGEDFLDGTYDLEHHSDIGVKYSSIAGYKITYSDRITNFAGGCWRIAKDSSPYTLYYANSSRVETLPLTGWVSIESDDYTGVVTLSACNGDFEPIMSVTPTPTPSTTPAPTPTPTPTPSVSHASGLKYTHNELTEYVVVKGVPTINYVSHLNIKPDDSYNILLTGYSLNYTTSVYLSCNNDSYPMSEVQSPNPAQFTNFMGYKIDYSVVSENELIISIPASQVESIIDIIVVTPAGYGKLNPTYQPVSTEWVHDNLQHSTIKSIN